MKSIFTGMTKDKIWPTHSTDIPFTEAQGISHFRLPCVFFHEIPLTALSINFTEKHSDSSSGVSPSYCYTTWKAPELTVGQKSDHTDMNI